MRSFGFTFLLLLATLFLGALAGWQWFRGNFDTIFGAPPTPVGQRIYTGFTPAEVKHIKITRGRTTASFSLRENGWQAATPWVDRMDPRAAVGIVNFTLGMRVEDFAPVGKIDPAKTGLDDTHIDIRLEDDQHRPLAKYNIGRATTWMAEVEGMEDPVPTVFVQPRDKHRKGHVYACTGNINSLFKDDLGFLRDHRPFYFNPILLSKITIGTQKGDLTLGRENPKDPWRIVKPLDLPTDPEAIRSLIEGLYELQSVKVFDRAAVTLPAKDKTATVSRISLLSFGSDTETSLEIFPPENPEAREVLAAVSDRPDTIFALPLKPEPGLVSLADLPLTANDLRDPTLTHLNVQSLRGIAIDSLTSPPIVLTCSPPDPWLVAIDGLPQKANEENLYTLIMTVTESRVTGFESDAATDFTPWGLDRPFLKLRFLGANNQSLELRFGMDGKGGVFVNRLGTPTVVRADPALLSAIPIRPFEWRHSLLWSLNRVHLTSVKRQTAGESPLILNYDFLDESWQAEQDGGDISAKLDPVRANYMLSVLEGIRTSRWLAPDDEATLAALENPSLTFTVVEQMVDDDDEPIGELDRSLSFAPSAVAGYHCGKLEGEPYPFLIPNEVYLDLAANLFEK